MPLIELSEDDARKLKRLLGLRVRGPGVRQTPFGGVTVNPPRPAVSRPAPTRQPPTLALLSITSAATPGGLYNATAWDLHAPVPTSGTITFEALGTGQTETVYALYTPEVGTSSHALTHADNAAAKRAWGWKLPILADDGKAVYAVMALPFYVCTTP